MPSDERRGTVMCAEHKVHLMDCFSKHYPNAFRDEEDEDRAEPMTPEMEEEMTQLMHLDVQEGYGNA